MIKNILIISFALTIIFGCGSDTKKNKPDNAFSKKELIPLNYAKGFKVFDTDKGFFFEIYNPQTNVIVDTFLLSDKSINIKTISPKINNIIVYSSTYISFLSKIDKLQTIKGVTYAKGIFNSIIKEKIKQGKIKDIGSEYAPNKELIITINPDIIFTAPSYNSSNWLDEMDISKIYLTEYLENHPLAQAEWIKFYGYLFNKVETCDSIFNSIENKYNSLINNSKIGNKPNVLGGELYDNFWTLPGGKSITSKLIEDAGGNYINFNNNTAGSHKIDFEVILNDQLKYDYWIFPSYKITDINKKSLIRQQEKYKFLDILTTNNISVCNTAKTPYFEKGMIEPHVILNDLINIIQHQTDSNNTYFKTIK